MEMIWRHQADYKKRATG